MKKDYDITNFLEYGIYVMSMWMRHGATHLELYIQPKVNTQTVLHLVATDADPRIFDSKLGTM